ncbi:hypothetical protein [Methylotenera sp.]|uniref:hypothetical protein n=1 Tax=Methylotenera sp. TaxID=2051956 RepID=UPI00271C6A5D|nr:hypothetical protein [Methylotenera sp.]MDO9206166.1 hypothetical protein [Methylotenera sp.]
MNTYKATVKVSVTKTVTKNVEVLAGDADKAKIQLEAIYGKRNVVTYPTLVKK